MHREKLDPRTRQTSCLWATAEMLVRLLADSACRSRAASKGWRQSAGKQAAMSKLKILALVAICAALATLPVHAAPTAPPMAPAKASAAPTPGPPASAAETKFVAAAIKDLQARFATTAAATAGGYFRYTDEDQTGAISWVNTSNWAGDPTHPSQLWYDVSGKLIGADWSVLQSTATKAPSVWGISPSRWQDFSPAHVHFGITTPSGVQFGGAGHKSWSLVGSVDEPTKAEVVKLATLPPWKRLKIPPPRSPSDVAFVFPFPAVWDLQVWLVPNPLGAFAEHNPNVTPSANAKYQD